MPEFFFQPIPGDYLDTMKHGCLICTKCPKCGEYIGMPFHYGKKYMEARLKDDNIWFMNESEQRFLRTGECTQCQN